MRRYKKYVILALIILLALFIIIGIIINNKNARTKEENGKFTIVTSFYPVYILTANITQGANNISLVNMAETNVGCLHDYTLTTNDMKKIEEADLFIENGLGLEKFMDKVLETNPNIQIVDSSQNIINLIEENGETNPHIWTSVTNYIEQVKNVSNQLIEKNPENAEIYKANTEEYINKLSELKLQYETALQPLSGKSIVSLNEAFAYLAKDLQLNVVSINTDHEKTTLSAEQLKNIIDTVKTKNIQTIIVDVNDNTQNAETIANETGATIYKLDSALTGSLSKDAYLNIMQGNLETLKAIK